MKKRIIEVAGFKVEVHDFGKPQGSFYYPEFNGNAEFPVTAKGYRKLSSYLRTISYYRLLAQGDLPMSSLSRAVLECLNIEYGKDKY